MQNDAEHDRHGDTALPLVTATQAVLAATFLALCPPVQAQSASPELAYGLSGRIGLGVATVPTYEGSPNRRALAGPDLSLSYRSRNWGTVEFGQRGLFWSAVEAGRFRFALVAQFVRALRLRFGTLHRLAGRVFLLAGAGLALSGLALMLSVERITTGLLDAARGNFELALIAVLALGESVVRRLAVPRPLQHVANVTHPP